MRGFGTWISSTCPWFRVLRIHKGTDLTCDNTARFIFILLKLVSCHRLLLPLSLFSPSYRCRYICETVMVGFQHQLQDRTGCYLARLPPVVDNLALTELWDSNHVASRRAQSEGFTGGLEKLLCAPKYGPISCTTYSPCMLDCRPMREGCLRVKS
jgi:hypothetical protein